MPKFKLKYNFMSGFPYHFSDKTGIDNHALLNSGKTVELPGIDAELSEYLEADNTGKPTSANTKAEIKTYLDTAGISYSETDSKSALLDKV